MKIKFGVGRRCINPELPISLAGYFNKRMWNEVLDDLEVRAVVLKSGGEYAAIIQFDLLCINYRLYRAVEKAVKKADIKNISIKNLLICATHTHTAPDINGDPNSEKFIEFAALLGCIARFGVHFISGITLYAITGPTAIEGTNLVLSAPVLFSLVYNGLYMIPDTIIAVVGMAILHYPLMKLDKTLPS